jgi:hypothetical protein
MFNKLFYLIGVIIAVLLLMSSVTGGSAQVIVEGRGNQPDDEGFLTLANGNGDQILVYCTQGLADTVLTIHNGEPVAVGTSLGTPCSAASFPGFEVVFNLDPREGWVIAPPNDAITADGSLMAYACTYTGAAFAIVHPTEGLYFFPREGDCRLGTYPG